MQNVALSPVELHTAGDCPALSFLKVSLHGLPAFKEVNRFSDSILLTKKIFSAVVSIVAAYSVGVI